MLPASPLPTAAAVSSADAAPLNARQLLLRETGLTAALALPMMAGQVGQMLMGLADTIMVGKLGVTPLAAAAFANSVLGVFFVAGIGITSPVSVLASQAHGAGREREAGEVLRHGLFLALLAGLAVVAVCGSWVGLGGLEHVGQPPEVAAEARTFLLLVTVSLVPALLWQSLKQFCEAHSRPLPPLHTMTGAVVFNIGLNWLLIYGHWGFPALGLAGAGLSTLVARCLMLAALAVFTWRDRILRAALPLAWKDWSARFSPAMLRQQLGLGLPVSAQLLFEVGAFGVAALMMGWLGKEALAAHQIAINCAATTFMFPLGLSLAVSVRIGQAVGAGAGRRVLRTIGYGGIGLGGLMMTASALAFIAWGRPIAGWFIADEGVGLLAARLLVVAGIFQIADGVQVVSAGALRGLKDVTIPTYIALGAFWLVALPACYLAGFVWRWGPAGVWSGLALGLGCAAVSLTWRFGRLSDARENVDGASPRPL